MVIKEADEILKDFDISAYLPKNMQSQNKSWSNSRLKTPKSNKRKLPTNLELSSDTLKLVESSSDEDIQP